MKKSYEFFIRDFNVNRGISNGKWRKVTAASTQDALRRYQNNFMQTRHVLIFGTHWHPRRKVEAWFTDSEAPYGYWDEVVKDTLPLVKE